MKGNVPRPPHQHLVQTGLLLGLSALAAACSDETFADPFALAPCQDLPRATIAVSPELVPSLEELQPALVDAGTRLVQALPPGSLKTELTSSLKELSTLPPSADTFCRLYLLSDRTVKRLDTLDDPASLPDRKAIRMVLDLTRAALGVS